MHACMHACMDVLKVNRFRRSYHPGKSLGSDVRTQVIDTIIAEEGDRATGFIIIMLNYYNYVHVFE